MALQLAQSLVSQHSLDPEDVLLRYMMWWRKEGFDTGPVADGVFSLVAQGVPYQIAVLRMHRLSGGMTAGCNPAHRSVPLAMAGFLSDQFLHDAACDEAALTHYDPLAGHVAAWSVKLCRALITGSEWSATLKSIPFGISKLADNPTPLLKIGGYAPDVLVAAVYFVNQHPDIESVLNSAIYFAGPANYCPVLAGAFAGARWGRDSIPDSALRHCRDILPVIEDTAAALLKTWD